MNTPQLKTPASLRVAGLVLSVLATTVIFGAVAIGLTWEAGAPVLILTVPARD